MRYVFRSTRPIKYIYKKEIVGYGTYSLPNICLCTQNVKIWSKRNEESHSKSDLKGTRKVMICYTYTVQTVASG